MGFPFRPSQYSNVSQSFRCYFHHFRHHHVVKCVCVRVRAYGVGGWLFCFGSTPSQVTSYPEAEQDASADTPLIAPQGAQAQQQQFMQMQLASGNQVRMRFSKLLQPGAAADVGRYKLRCQ